MTETIKSTPALSFLIHGVPPDSRMLLDAALKATKERFPVEVDSVITRPADRSPVLVGFVMAQPEANGGEVFEASQFVLKEYGRLLEEAKS